MRIKAKQLDALVGQARWNTSGVAIPAAGSVVVTSHFNGRTGGGSDILAGVYTGLPQNKVYLRTKADGKAISDETVGNDQVYARLTEASNVWTLTFFTVIAGVETAFNFTGHSQVGELLEYRWCESVQLANAVPTAVVDVGESIDEFLATSPLAHMHVQEEIPVTSNGQTVLTLAYTPKDPTDVAMSVNGIGYRYGASKDYTVVGTTLTWSNQSFTLETTDSVVVEYAY